MEIPVSMQTIHKIFHSEFMQQSSQPTAAAASVVWTFIFQLYSRLANRRMYQDLFWCLFFTLTWLNLEILEKEAKD